MEILNRYHVYHLFNFIGLMDMCTANCSKQHSNHLHLKNEMSSYQILITTERKDLIPGNDGWFSNPPLYPPFCAKRYLQPTIGYWAVKARASRSGILFLRHQHSLPIG